MVILARTQSPEERILRQPFIQIGAAVGRGFRAAATMDAEQYFEAGEGAKAV
jgi:hypothetical protein